MPPDSYALAVLVSQGDIEQIMEEFKAFKKNVPVMGGILLDQDMQRVLLVKGWKNTACWGFPRGKIHKNETDAQCAVREVRGRMVCLPQCAHVTPSVSAVTLKGWSPPTACVSLGCQLLGQIQGEPGGAGVAGSPC